MKKKKALPGFEPGYDGFAIRCLSAWLKGHVFDTTSIGASPVQLERSRASPREPIYGGQRLK
jgi:hypothetical protein